VRATRTLGNTDVALIGMGLDMPLAENPGAITKAQADSARRGRRCAFGFKEGAKDRASGAARIVGDPAFQ
jgi:hypothetical protein